MSSESLGETRGAGAAEAARARPSTSRSADGIRVLLLLTSTAGGAGLQNYLLVKHMSRGAFDLTVGFGPGYPLDREFAGLNVRIRQLSMSRKISPAVNLRGFLQIWRLIRQGDFDVVCTSCSIAGLMGRVAAALSDTPATVHVLHVYASRPYQNELKRAGYRWIERALDRLTTRYVAVSESAKTYGVETGIMSADKVDVIFNAVEPPRRSGKPAAEIRSELGLAEQGFVVGTLGRYETQKGIEYLLRAAPIVLDKHPDAQFLVVGDGPLRGELEALARELKIEDAVRFTGWRDDVPDVLAVMDVFCLASLWETFGLVLAEAMYAGLPVVATRVDAVPEVAVDGETGILVPPRNPEALAAAILRMAADPELARQMGEAGRKRVTSVFSLDRMVDGYERLFQSLARRARQPDGATSRGSV